jgi:hypothetical protein
MPGEGRLAGDDPADRFGGGDGDVRGHTRPDPGTSAAQTSQPGRYPVRRLASRTGPVSLTAQTQDAKDTRIVRWLLTCPRWVLALLLLARYVTHELDQWEHWRIETPLYGSVYIDLSVVMAPGATEDGYATIWPLPHHLRPEQDGARPGHETV